MIQFEQGFVNLYFLDLIFLFHYPLVLQMTSIHLIQQTINFEFVLFLKDFTWLVVVTSTVFVLLKLFFLVNWMFMRYVLLSNLHSFGLTNKISTINHVIETAIIKMKFSIGALINHRHPKSS